jgi:hypothetical protein
MADGIGLAEKMLGLPGLVVLEVEDVPGEVVVRVESTRPKPTCPSCRKRAEAHDRVEVHLRDAHCFGRPCRLVINKRRWRCRTPGCVKKTWTEKISGVAPRQVLTVRAGAGVTPPGGPALPLGGVGGRRGWGWAGTPPGPPSSSTAPRSWTTPAASVGSVPSGSTSTLISPPRPSTRPSTRRAWSIWTGAS